MIDITFKAKRLDNGEMLESDSILQFKNHAVTKAPAASLWEEGNGWIAVDPETLQISNCRIVCEEKGLTSFMAKHLHIPNNELRCIKDE